MLQAVTGQVHRGFATSLASGRESGEAPPMTRRSFSLVLLATLAACSGNTHDPYRRPQIVISPNAEPLALGDDKSCKVEMVGWFARVDTNHDGAIDKAEFMADARRWFAEMDQDKSGSVTAGELANVRERKVPLPPPPPRRPDSDSSSTSSSSSDGRMRQRFGDRLNAGEGQMGGGQMGGGQMGSGSARRDRPPSDLPDRPKSGLRNGVAGEPDPVMAADTNLDFKVTKLEWETYVESNFDELDRNHDGRLSPDEVASSCETPLARR
ncbi:MAG: hypothetical protein JWM77_93 [Rhodospirillales bacterium]|nr:hypothetical protein [Rhodospirillales bacterium]